MRLSTMARASTACATFLFGAALLTQLLGPAHAAATEARAGGRPGFPAGPSPFNPAGNTPLNPAGPTPRNPAGPTPLNPAGSFAPGNFGGRQVFVGGGGFVQPQPFVAIVGPVVGPAFDGAFFCQVHGRSFASSEVFFDHLARWDGVAPAEVPNLLVDGGGGVWVFTGP